MSGDKTGSFCLAILVWVRVSVERLLFDTHSARVGSQMLVLSIVKLCDHMSSKFHKPFEFVKSQRLVR